MHGDIAVFKSGTYGHVAVVDVVDGNNMAIVEQNWNYGRYRRTISIRDADGFLHVTANNGNNTPTDSGANPNPGLQANICNQQSVSNAHTVDGIPAYDQCGNYNGVWSDDGIHTRDHASSGWVRTQWSGGYQCTEFAFRYLRFKWRIQSALKGDAGEWCRGTAGLTNTENPVHGDVAVFAANSCGAGSFGHVAVVDKVNGNTVSVVEQNWGAAAKGNRRNVDISCARCFLHAELNTSGTTAAASEIGNSAGLNGFFDARVSGNTVTIHLNGEWDQNTSVYLHDLSGKRAVNLRITKANKRQFILKPGVGVFLLTVKKGESASSRMIVLVK